MNKVNNPINKFDIIQNHYDNYINNCKLKDINCKYFKKYGNCRISWCMYNHVNICDTHDNNLCTNDNNLCTNDNNLCTIDNNRNFSYILKNDLQENKKIKLENKIINNDPFIGINWNDKNLFLCNIYNCDCSKHNMQLQKKTVTFNIFEKALFNKNINLQELIKKLNDIYKNNLHILEPILVKHSLVDYNNEIMSLESLEKIFTLIGNDSSLVKTIYKNNISQKDYSILYEIFRRIKQCPRFKNFQDGKIYDKNNNINYCHYGINCIKGHHNINAICREDFLYGKCECSNNLDKIEKLEKELLKSKNDIDEEGFILLQKTNSKNIKQQIELIKMNNKIHLNRDKLCL
jgi:hypothetical protein